MDDRRFDAITQAIAVRTSRRQLLAAMIGLGAAGFGRPAGAARRPTPTPQPVTCPGSQIWNGSECGCQTGTTCGSDCCGQGSVCCDGACCDGSCYGEELCCPPGSIVVDGACFVHCAGEMLTCPEACDACVIIEESNPIEICANVVAQQCSSSADCLNNGAGWACSPFGNQCLHPC